VKPVSGGHEEFFFPGQPMGLSIVEALDTLWLMGLDAEFEEGLDWVVANLHFDIDAEIQLFECSIRLLGGLLAAHHACGDARLLALARDLASRLVPAFERSPTGMPYRFVNLRTGAVRRDPVTFPAEVGSYLPEWGTLAKLTGERRFYDLPKAAVKAMFDRRSETVEGALIAGADERLYLAPREIADHPFPAHQPIGPPAGPGERPGDGVSDVAVGARYEDCPLRHDLSLRGSRLPLIGL
jgi:hypothetical protein